MTSAVRAGRAIGALLIVNMVGSSMVNFVLETPIFGTPGFLPSAAEHAPSLGVAAVLGVAIEAIWVAIAILAFPVLRRRAPSAALLLIVLAGVLVAAALVESAAVLSMVSVSEAYAKASAGEREQLEAVRILVKSARNWPHFLARAMDGITILVFSLALFRARVVPRSLAGFGMATAVLQICGVAPPFFGGEVVFPMLAPLGLYLLGLAIWLLVKGLRPASARAREAMR